MSASRQRSPNHEFVLSIDHAYVWGSYIKKEFRYEFDDCYVKKTDAY